MKMFKNLNFEKLKKGLSKTKKKLVVQINETLSGKAILDDELLENLEEILVTADINYDITEKIIENTQIKMRSVKDRSQLSIINVVKDELKELLKNYKTDSEFEKIEKYKPYVILVVGVNGVGKTTTIGKLAHNYKKAGLSVVIGSADTFRAAANEQLEIWANRVGVEIIRSIKGADPAAVTFDTLNFAKSKNVDVVLIDTAGRLHTKNNLMNELNKIERVMGKVLPYAPNDVFLVVDGNTGQNAIVQAHEFSKYTKISGLIVTKLDGTAKGGMVFSICKELKIPLRYIGVGEGIDDLLTFEPQEFVDALFD
jgi:fused signal recognition particle receptor